MTLEEFQTRLQDNKLPVIVDIWADWCMPCRVMAPAVERSAKQFAGQVDVWKVDADQEPALVQALRVYGIPTLIAYRQGQEIARRTGAQSPAALEALFAAAASGEAPHKPGLSPSTRGVRLLGGLGLLVFGWFSGPSVLLALLGGLVLFSAIYDRCPIWQAIAPRLSKAWQAWRGAAQ